MSDEPTQVSQRVDAGRDVHGDVNVAGGDIVNVDDRDNIYIEPPRKKRGGCFAVGLGVLGAVATILGLIAFFALDLPALMVQYGFVEPTATRAPAATDTPRPTNTPRPPEPTATPPHAPSIDSLIEGNKYTEDTILITVQPGEEVTVYGGDMYAVVEILASPPVSCINETAMAFSWQVRDPYPGGDELEIVYPYRGTRLEVGAGESGTAYAGPCTELVFINHSLETYQIEIRYAVNPGGLGG